MTEKNKLQMDEGEKKDVSTDEEMKDKDANSDEEFEPRKSSDSESDSEAEDESVVRQEIEKVESELAANPSNYDAHVQHVKLLRKVYEIERLNKAREEMSVMFPLTPEMWMEWARDEASQASGPESFSSVERLYDRGVSEYLSVPLWCEYLNYVQQHVPITDISRIRTLFERATTAAGSHIAEGHRIWEAYREFELNILHKVDQHDHKGRESQVQRIMSIFHRHLSVPLLDMKSPLLAFKSWDVKQKNSDITGSEDLEGIVPHVAVAYQKASKMLNDRLVYEELILNQNLSESDKFQNFMNYLNFEKIAGDPARVQLLYERAIAAFPVSSDLWLDYTSYLDRTLKVGTVLRDVYLRATRNCPWVGEIWVRYLLSLERSHATEADICRVYESSLQSTFSTVDEYLNLFLTRVDGLRRKIAAKEESLVEYSLIKNIFQYASDFLSPQIKNTDGLLNLYAYWARLEHSVNKDLTAARQVWESLLKISGSMLESWLGYIRMETELGNIAEARAIYKRCYSKRFPGTGSEEICQFWLRFEREFGTLEDFDHAMLKITPRLKELQMYKAQQESKGASESAGHVEKSSSKTSREKRKAGLNDGEKPASKKPKQAARSHGESIEKSADHTQKEDIDTNATDVKSMEDMDHKFNEREFSSAHSKSYTDRCTAFLSNISLQATYEDLRKFFGDAGGVVDIRILRDKFTGKSRGLAYVDFTDDAHLAAAVAKNKQTFLGKRLSIARSDPKHSKRDGHANPKTQAKPSGRNRQNIESRETSSPKDGNIELKGSVTFAVPRNVKWKDGKPKATEGRDETPKSNDEFRKLFIKE